MPGTGNIAATITLNGKSYSSTAGQIVSLNKKLKSSIQDAGHATVSSMQASSAAIRTLENPLGNNLRAVERFISTIPGVSKALQFAFPVVGAIALGSVIVKTTEEVFKFIEVTKKLAENAKKGFDDLNDKGLAANDTLRLTNDQLRNQIAQLERKPQNGLAIALDEARIKADGLLGSLKEDFKAVDELLKANKGSLWGQLLGQGADKEVTGNIQNFEKLITNAARSVRDAQQAGNAGAAASARAALDQLYANAQAYVKQQVDMRTSGRVQSTTEGQTLGYAEVYGDQTKNLNTLSGFGDVLANLKDREGLEDDNLALGKQKQHLEAVRSYSQEQIRQMHELLEQKKSVHAFTEQDEADFWAAELATVKKGSAPYLEALKEMSRARSQMLIDTARENVKFGDESGKAAFDLSQNDLSRDPEVLRGFEETGKQDVQRLGNINEQVTLYREFSDALREEAVASQIASGALNKYDAAVARLALDQQKYAELVSELHNRNASPADLQRASQDDQLQQIKDQQAIADTLFVNQWKKTLNEMANQFTDFASQTEQIFRQTVDSINDELATIITSNHHGHGQIKYAFEGIARQGLHSVANASLKGVEGYAATGLKNLLGSHKPLGTRGDPINVRNVDGTPGGTASSLSGVGAAVSSALPGAGGGFLNTVLSVASLAGFADGGPVGPNVPIVVGERGPEVFMPRTFGHIVPNEAAFGGGGDTHHHHYHIDARGSSDPSATEAAVRRAMNQAMKKAVEHSAKAQAEYRARRPRLSQ